jgi:GT2 family glycosyltransferase
MKIKTKDRFTILLVNYKTPEMTRLCLKFLKKIFDSSQIDIVLVDNSSTRKSFGALNKIKNIELVARVVPAQEAVHISHAKGLDFGLAQVKTRYVLLIHTDTLIYDPSVIDLLFARMKQHDRIAAVGTVEQRLRNLPSRLFRLFKNAARYSSRRISRPLGLTDKIPKPITDRYLKSFCCLWDADLVKSRGLKFCADDRNPGYSMQDELEKSGYEFVRLPAKLVFNHLDHIQSGTMVENNAYLCTHRRVRAYQKIIASRCHMVTN